MPIETLQTLLNKKAEEALKKEIEVLLKPFYAYTGSGVYVTVATFNNEPVKKSLTDVIDSIRKSLFDNLVAKRKEQAVKDFLSEVEEMRNDLNSLSEDYNNAQR